MPPSNLPFRNRIPQQPEATSSTNYMYPSDLTGSERNIYMVMNICTYNANTVLDNAQLQQGPSIALPIPMKINDQQVVTWDQASITEIGASLITSALGRIGGKIGSTVAGLVGEYGQVASQGYSITSGKVVNPFLAMLFKTQNFKEHVFQWFFAPKNQQDTDSLQDIVKQLKAAQLPSADPNFSFGGASFVLNYPNLLQINFSNDNLYQFKPAAIISVSIENAAGGTPAFFNNGSPAMVALTLQVREVELWYNNGPGQIV